MEFERTLFRVYERTVSTLSAPPVPEDRGRLTPRRFCRGIEVAAGSAALILLVLLIILHSSFQGTGGCLPAVLNRTAGLQPGGGAVAKDVLLNLFVSTDAVPRTQANGSHYPGDPAIVATYRFTKSAPVFYLDASMREAHNFTSLDVMLPADQCIGNAALRWLVQTTVGYDTIVINMLVHGLPGSDGIVRNMDTKELWNWEKRETAAPAGFGEALGKKIGVLLQSVLAFFLISTVTAMLVRVLITSGVVLIFPVFFCLQRFAVARIDFATLIRSYPWLGAELAGRVNSGRPISPLICAHLGKVVVLYTMYEGCQVAWSFWLYNKSTPGGMKMCIFATVMLWEYFSMIFVRSRTGIRFFPRFSALYFLAFHM